MLAIEKKKSDDDMQIEEKIDIHIKKEMSR